MQIPYNMLVRDLEREVLPAAEWAGVGTLVFQSLAGGMLTGRYDESSGPAAGTRLATRDTDRARYWNAASFALANRIQSLANAFDRRPEELALGWILANSAVNPVIIGAERINEIANNSLIANRPLEPEKLRAIAAALETPAA